MESAQAARVGQDFRWHYGRVTRLGSYDVLTDAVDRRSVTIMWESGGLSCQYGEIGDDQWENQLSRSLTIHQTLSRRTS